MLRQFVFQFESDVRYRAEFTIERGSVTWFVVQLEVHGEEKWRPVVRYDTAHGFAHRDRYFPDGTESKHEPLPFGDLNGALTHAIETIKRDWRGLAQPFRRSKS